MLRDNILLYFYLFTIVAPITNYGDVSNSSYDVLDQQTQK
ncbi:hypothetical protein M214_4251 [Acinetobacter baumannii CI86]|nr:hypothetical protein M212_2542 [Acinetobacter baumannii CI79]ETR92173.1 hypothetical protein M214_4251 [Acinetobacter baumannii CI86]KCY20139.1 hypothetical protein J635_3447 [Acinetobacter baumannii 233846]QCR58543.1 hypothetical protein D1G37_00114 [Acinetobacter baumannii]